MQDKRSSEERDVSESEALRVLRARLSLDPRRSVDYKLISEWLRWIVIALFALSTFYLRTTFVSKEAYAADKLEERKRLDLVEQERSLRLERINTSMQELSLSIRTVQADKTPAYLAERIAALERDAHSNRGLLQELIGAVGVMKQNGHLNAKQND